MIEGRDGEVGGRAGEIGGRPGDVVAVGTATEGLTGCSTGVTASFCIRAALLAARSILSLAKIKSAVCHKMNKGTYCSHLQGELVLRLKLSCDVVVCEKLSGYQVHPSIHGAPH